MIELPIWYEQYFWLFIVVGLFELVLKGFALWHSARGRQLAWYIAILVINSAGILPIIYLLFFKKKAATVKSVPAKKKRR
jgi:methionyl-tRNA synthetase